MLHAMVPTVKLLKASSSSCAAHPNGIRIDDSLPQLYQVTTAEKEAAPQRVIDRAVLETVTGTWTKVRTTSGHIAWLQVSSITATAVVSSSTATLPQQYCLVGCMHENEKVGFFTVQPPLLAHH